MDLTTTEVTLAWLFVAAAVAQPLVMLGLWRRAHRRSLGLQESRMYMMGDRSVEEVAWHQTRRYKMRKHHRLMRTMRWGWLHFRLARWCTPLASWWTMEKTMTPHGHAPPWPRYRKVPIGHESWYQVSTVSEYEEEMQS